MGRKLSKKNKIKIVERGLGREGVWGFCYKEDNLIELDKNLMGKRRLMVLCHELVHKIAPDMSESAVLKAERILGNALWSQGYRRVDNRLK